ncbi:MAG: hypothetical protein BWY47_01533 [Bacteroidetes bacterium ADurb.Bin302]|jgi:hypothetical protein|nr:MAG: hypothetical protein BWY47_01533 [Bacteroidetes bacterium ADurb.Bin302]
MNRITEYFDNIPDEELKSAITEIQEDEPLGIIRVDGLVRKYTRDISEITQNPVSTELFLVQMNLFKQAAFRWVQTNV